MGAGCWHQPHMRFDQASVEVALFDPLGVYAVAFGSKLDNVDMAGSVKRSFDVAPEGNGPKESVGITAKT